MKWLKWEQGRQNSGYDKLLLATSKRFGFDLYLLRFHQNCVVPYHLDPASPGFHHHRINFTLIRADEGGEQVTKGETQKWWRFEKFRPDIQQHGLRRVIKGKVYMLSLGYIQRSI